jgi:O-antigen/teichoic acid export membrane protein
VVFEEKIGCPGKRPGFRLGFPANSLDTQMSSSSPAVPLGRSVSWALVGNVFYAICQWGAVVLLARLGSVEVLGRFALALALTAPVFLLASLQLRSILATDAREQFRFMDYAALRWLAMMAALLAAGLLAPRDSADAFATVAFIALAKSFEGLSDVIYGQHQRLERMDRVAISLVLRGAAGLLGIVGGLEIAGTAAAAAAGMALAWGLVLLVYDIGFGALPAFGKGTTTALRRSNAPRIRALMRLSLPLGLVLMLVSLQSNIPRYFLDAYGGSKALGAFAAVSSFLSVGIVIVGALGQSAAPRMSRRFSGGEYPAFLRLVGGVCLAAVGVGVIGWVVAVVGGASLLGLLLGEPYRPFAPELAWLMAMGIVAYVASALGYALTAARRIHVQVPMLLVACLAVAGASFALIPRHGILGAAWAVGAGFTVQALGSLGVLWKSAP